MAVELHGPFRIWIDEQEITAHMSLIDFGRSWIETIGSGISMFPTDEATGTTLDDLLGEDE